MRQNKMEYIIYKKTSLGNMFPIETHGEEDYDIAVWRLNNLRECYPQCTFVLVKRVATEEVLEV